MQRTRHLAAVLLLALLASACASTPTIRSAAGPGEVAASHNGGVDPNWHLTEEELLLADPTAYASSTSSATTTAAAATATQREAIVEEPNDGAKSDQFVMDLFPTAQPQHFGRLQAIVGGYCLGLVDSASISALTTDTDVHEVVFDISEDECDELETSAIVLRGSPVEAATWDEAVSRRFARTVWWFDEADFANRAKEACQAGHSAGALDFDTDLSVSVAIELAAFTTQGDCALLTAGDDSAVQTTSAAEASFVDAPTNENVTLYFLRASSEENIADRKRDLYALSVATGEVTRVTTGQEVNAISLSPAGSRLAYLADSKESSRLHDVYVSGPFGADARVIASGVTAAVLHWTPDGTGLVYGLDSAEGGRTIAIVDPATGTSTVVAEPTQRNLWPIGFTGDHLLYQDSDGNDPLVVRHDLASGEIVDSLLVPYGTISLSPAGSQLIVGERSTGELSQIDLSAASMALTPLPSGPGKEAWPAISPNNRYVAYGVGPEFRANQVHVTDVTAPETRVHLTADLEAGDVGKTIWRPDSQAVFFNAGEFDFETMYMVTINGIVTDLEEVGRPLLVVETP